MRASDSLSNASARANVSVGRLKRAVLVVLFEGDSADGMLADVVRSVIGVSGGMRLPDLTSRTEFVLTVRTDPYALCFRRCEHSCVLVGHEPSTVVALGHGASDRRTHRKMSSRGSCVRALYSFGAHVSCFVEPRDGGGTAGQNRGSGSISADEAIVFFDVLADDLLASTHSILARLNANRSKPRQIRGIVLWKRVRDGRETERISPLFSPLLSTHTVG